MTIQSDTEAFTQALVLAITAPTHEKEEQVMQFAGVLAARLTPEEVEACMAIAKEMANQ